MNPELIKEIADWLVEEGLRETGSDFYCIYFTEVAEKFFVNVELVDEYAEDIYEVMQIYSEYDLTPEEAKELGDRKIINIWDDIDEAAEDEARCYGYLTDDNERWFNLELYREDLLEGNYMEFKSTGRVVCYE